ncbi:MAG: hypothetical protein RLZZ397_932 [Pseudomonadota bacterium]
MPDHLKVSPRLRTQGIVLAMAGAMGFAAKAIVAKLAYRYGVDAITVLMYRMLFAGPIFAAMALMSSRGKAPLTSQQWRSVLMLGFTGYYLASYLDFMGLQYISASLERLILYLNPTFVLLLGWLQYRRRVNQAQVVGMVISYSGVLMVFAHELQFDGWTTVWGSVLVLGCAISYAVYLIHSGELVKQLGSIRLVGWATSVASVLCLLHFVLTRPLSAAWVPWEVLGLSAINAVLCTVAPVLLVMMAIERIGAGMASQVGMIGPMATLMMGAVWLDEPFTAWVLAGTALVLSGVFWVGRSH